MMTHDQIKYKAGVVANCVEYLLDSMVTFDLQESENYFLEKSEFFVLFKTEDRFRQLRFETISNEDEETLIFHLIEKLGK